MRIYGDLSIISFGDGLVLMSFRRVKVNEPRMFRWRQLLFIDNSNINPVYHLNNSVFEILSRLDTIPDTITSLLVDFISNASSITSFAISSGSFSVRKSLVPQCKITKSLLNSFDG